MALSLLCSCIKQHGNSGSLVQFTFHSDLAMMILHGVLHDRQSKAGAAGLLGMALIHTIKTLKHLVLMFGCNPDTTPPVTKIYFAIAILLT